MRAERPGSDVLVVVALGGIVGAAVRYGVAQAITTPAGGFPLATFLTNVVGAFVLGLFVAVAATSATAGPTGYLRPFFAVGVLGSFTTFSTFAVENVVLVDGGDVLTAAAYVVATLVVGVGAARFGIAAGRRLDRSGVGR